MCSAVKSGDREAGVSLIELTVAVLILSLAAVGMFRTLDQGVLVAGSAEDRFLATLVARNHAEALQLPGTTPSRTVSLGGRDWEITRDQRETRAGFIEVDLLVTSRQTESGARLRTIMAPTEDRP